MSRSFSRQWLQLSVLWVIVALVPIGRLYLNGQLHLLVWFHVIILIFGLILCPLLLLWLLYLQKKEISWFLTVFIQFGIAILLSLWFYYTVQENPMIVKQRISESALMAMEIPRQIAFHFFLGNSYSIFTSMMMLSGFGLLITYTEQTKQSKLRYSEFERQLNSSVSAESTYSAQNDKLPGRRIAIKTGKRYDFIDPNDITYVCADGNYCDIKLKLGSNFLHRTTITELCSNLPEEYFLRIHQSYVVSLEGIAQVKRLPFGELEVIMTDGRHLKVSRKYKKRVTELLIG